MILLTRKIEFSASHLYHNPSLSAEENRRIFGKCNNPHGHGHNYTLEVTVAGEPDPVTGMVLDLKELKEILEKLLDPKITQGKLHRVRLYESADLFADCYRNGASGAGK
jgi:6-pyruvoyltetrahydropterin/6-carboxytetrahydropterin synthase